MTNVRPKKTATFAPCHKPYPKPIGEARAARMCTAFHHQVIEHGEETVALLAIGASMLKLKVERCGGENNRKILTEVSASTDVTITAPNALAGCIACRTSPCSPRSPWCIANAPLCSLAPALHGNLALRVLSVAYDPAKSLANASRPTAVKARCADVGRRIRPTAEVPHAQRIRWMPNACKAQPCAPVSRVEGLCCRAQHAASILSNDTPNNTPHIADADARGAQTIWIWWGRVSALQEEAGRLRGAVDMAVEKWEEETSTAEQMVAPHPPSSTTQRTGAFLRIFQVLRVCEPSSREVGCHWKEIREEGRTCKRNDTPGSKAAKPTTPYTITEGKKRGMLAQSGQATLENIVALQQHGLKADSKAFNTTKKYGEVVVAGGKWLEEYVGGEKTGKEKKGKARQAAEEDNSESGEEDSDVEEEQDPIAPDASEFNKAQDGDSSFKFDAPEY
ncbi:hypothetical protein B0H14DRAFT_3432531 [Mycena olivaceomarginata]|nr:hypothetical protein B0H14DRAFT_3432531 [Mycena olivaceomarginata]